MPDCRMVFIAVLTVVLGGLCAEAASQLGDIIVAPAAAPVGQPQYGYIEHRIALRNRGTRERKVRLVLPGRGRSGSQGERISELSRTVVVGPGASVSVAMPQPPLRMGGSDHVRVYIDGWDEGVVAMPYGLSSQFSRNNRVTYNVLVSRRINRDTLSSAIESKLGKKTSGRSGRQERVFVRSETPVTAWSDSWLAYSGFDGVMISSADLDVLPAAVRTALDRYAEMGGALTVLGRESLDGPGMGKGTSLNELTLYHRGFGRVVACPQIDPARMTARQFGELHRIWVRTGGPWSDINDGVSGVAKRLPVVEKLGVPVRGLFFIMLGFMIIIGPVNLTILSRKGHRIWMLWTVPAMATLTCGALFLFSAFSEGFTPTIRSLALTVLDQRSHRASTLGVLSYYCPLTPGDGLRFAQETELTPMVNRNAWNYGSARRVDCTLDQHFGTGWLSARVPTYFRVRKSETRRERLDVSRDDMGRLTAVNGLGVPIRKLWVSDSEGRVFTAKDVSAGKQAVLAPDRATKSSLKAFADLRAIHGGTWENKLLALQKAKAPSLLAPGTYFAELDGCPFVERGLEGKAHERQEALVFGILDSEVPGEEAR